MRRGIVTALDDYANKNDLPREYPEAFFTLPKASKKGADKTDEPVENPSTPRPRSTLSEGHQVLALPDAILRGLSNAFVAALPANVQSIVRAQRTG